MKKMGIMLKNPIENGVFYTSKLSASFSNRKGIEDRSSLKKLQKVHFKDRSVAE